jgi:hypothetical protein
LYIGRCHQRVQQQPQPVDENVTLLALDQLAGVELSMAARTRA